MNNLITNVLYSNASVLEKFTSACRNYIHHSPTSDYVRHRSSTKALSPTILELPTRTLDSMTVGKEYMELFFSIKGVLN